jgi:hypothetical protein
MDAVTVPKGLVRRSDMEVYAAACDVYMLVLCT